MKYLAVIIAAALLCGAILVATTYLDDANSRARAEAYRLAALERQQQLERDQRRAEALEGLDTALAGVWRVVPLLLVAGATVWLVDVWRVRRRLVRADRSGVLPVPRAYLDATPVAAMETLAAYHAARLAESQRPVLPQTLHYAPKLAPAAAPQDAADEAAALPLHVPTFRALLSMGTIHDGGPLVLGYDESGPITGTWKHLYSSAVAGMSGSGKSTTMRFLVAQAALHGARFALIDPHMETAPKDALAPSLLPLQRRMICAPVADNAGIVHTAKLVTHRLDARLRGDPNRTPLLLIVDEFTQTMRTPEIAAALALLLERIATEGRKVGIFAMLGGQTWGAARAGGTPLRNALASAYVHRIKRPEAMKLLQLGSDTPDTHNLPDGGAWLYRTSGDLVRVHVPQTTAADVAHVAGLLTSDATAAPTSSVTTTSAPYRLRDQAGGSDNGSDNGSDSAAPLPAHQDALDARAERVRALIKARTPHKDILRDVWGITASGGRAYTDASEALRAILATLV